MNILILMTIILLPVPRIATPAPHILKQHSNLLAISTVALIGASVADIETSFAAINNGAHESNPFMRPFMHSRASAYAMIGAMDALTIWVARRHHLPWLPLISASTHGVAAGLNLRY
jgi:hypothetical protein